MTKRSTLGGGALVALALLFVGLTMLFNHALRGWRLDLTENRLYTTAAGTDRILASIKEPINLYFFYSEKAAPAAAAAEDLRHARARVPRGARRRAPTASCILHVIDPQPFSEEEDRAAELGVRGVPVGAASSQFYFGLAGTNSTDGHAAIEFFDPDKEQFLEYDVVKLIYQLANPKKPVVGLAVDAADGRRLRSAQRPHARALDGAQRGAAAVRRAHRSSPPPRTIDPDINVLVLVHPKDLSPADAVRHRPVRAARRPHPAVRRSAGGKRHQRRRSAEPDGRDERGQVLAPGDAAQRLGRAVRPRQGGGRPRPCALR